MSKAKPAPMTSSPRNPRWRAASTAASSAAWHRGYSPRRYSHPCGAPGGEGGDRHRLDHGERVALHQHPVLEGAGLRLVGVAHEMVRVGRLVGHGVPLAAGRERRAAAADQPSLGHLADHLGGPDLDRPPQRLVAAGRPVVVDAGRIDVTDPPEQVDRRPDGRFGRRLRGRPAPATSSATSAAVAGAATARRAGSPASITSTAGARSHTPRQGDGCARRRAGRRRASRRRPGRPGRRRRAPGGPAARPARTGRRTWPRRRCRPAPRRGGRRCG